MQSNETGKSSSNLNNYVQAMQWLMLCKTLDVNLKGKAVGSKGIGNHDGRDASSESEENGIIKGTAGTGSGDANSLQGQNRDRAVGSGTDDITKTQIDR